MEILINGIDVTGLCISFSKYEETESLIGNTVSTQIKLTMRNKDNQLSDMLDYPFVIDGKTYLIYEKPEKWIKTISFTLYDLMILGNKAYKTMLSYPCTVSDQLDEISSLMGVDIDKTTLPSDLLQKQVAWYDNTIIIRNYLGWIAECAGTNVYIENDKIIFRKIALQTHETIISTGYELNDFITFSRVCLDDGVQNPISSGDETGNTLYISKENSYIDQTDVDRIYGLYNGLSFWSFKKFKSFEINEYHFSDLVQYHDITILPISIKTTISGGEAKNIIEMSCNINLKNDDSIIVHDDPNTRIRRVQTSINQLEKSYSVLAQDVEDNSEKIGELVISNEKISTEVSNNTKSIYKFESGSGNIFDNTYQFIAKDLTDLSEITINNMPLGIHKEELKGKDIVISVNADVKDGMFGELQGFVGAEFTVTFSDKTEETYKTRFYVGQTTFQYVLACNSLSIEKRIYTHYKLPDKDIQSVSNLKLICSVNGKSVYVANPKVEFGTYPTGYEFDISNIRDNIVTLDREFTLIEQKVDELSLQAVSMTQEITTIKGDVSTVTTRLESTELKLQPTNILLAVNEKIGSDGQLYTTKFILDKSGVHIKGGGLDISNNAGTKVLYADTSGNLVINNLNAVDGIFSGNIQGSTITGGTILGSSITGGTITGNTTISVGTNLTVGNNIYLGNYEDRDTKKYIYFNDQFWIGSRNNIITMGYENGHPFKGKVYVDTSGNIVSWANSLNFIEAGSNCLHLYEDRTTSTYSITVTSDARRKTNFKNPDTSWIYQLRVSGFEYLSCIGTEMIGLVAQDYVDYEWSKYFVRKNDDGYYSIDYQNVCMALLNEFIKLRNNFINANNEIAFLRSKIGGI